MGSLGAPCVGLDEPDDFAGPSVCGDGERRVKGSRAVSPVLLLADARNTGLEPVGVGKGKGHGWNFERKGQKLSARE